MGRVGAEGHCFAGRAETAPCAHSAAGELPLYAPSRDPDERAVGFFTAWLGR